MQCVHSVSIHVPREVRRAADAADSHHVVSWDAQLNQRLLYRREHTEIAASRTPVGIDFTFQIRHGQLLTGTLYACRHLRLRSEEHTSELQSQSNIVCRLLLEKKKK